MKELYKLKESLVNELADYGTKGGLTASTLDTIDKLAHATKNVIKVIECCDDEEYSGNDGYSRRMSHDEERYVRPDGSTQEAEEPVRREILWADTPRTAWTSIPSRNL